MNELALFAGAGGGILGGVLLGWRTVCAVEIDAFCARRLVQRQNEGHLPPFPIWDDVRTFDGRPWRGIVDVISGGFPCQDISPAGRGLGINGPQSGMWSEMSRIIGEVQPPYAWVENSPALTFRGIDRVLWDLAAMGYDAKWGVVGTSSVSGHCKGDRLWLVAAPAKSRWEKVLCRKQKCSHKASETKAANDANSYSRLDRIRLLESMAGEPAILGSDDGVAYRVDRLGAIGNGQVPAVVKLACEILTERG